MKTLKRFLRDHMHVLWALYLVFYMPWFSWLEKNVVTDFHEISIPLDQKIPFCEYFVIPYYAWFLFVIFAWGYLALVGKSDFYRFIGVLYTGMTFFLIFSTLYPNGQSLRFPIDPDKNFCTWLVHKLHSTDTPTNVFPSMHVFNSLVCCAGLCKCQRLKPYMVLRSLIILFTISICLSTLFLKQHSILDVLGACAMFGILYPIYYHLIPNILHKRSQKAAEKQP